MTEARIRTYNRDLVTFDQRTDEHDPEGLNLINPLGTGHNYLAKHEGGADGAVNLYRVGANGANRLVDSVPPEGLVEFIAGDQTQRIRITHHGNPRRI